MIDYLMIDYLWGDCNRPHITTRWQKQNLCLQQDQCRGVSFLTAGLEDGHGAVVQSADLLPEGAQALLVRRLVDRQHLLHLTQRVHQVVGGGTLLWRRRGDVRGQTAAAGGHQVSTPVLCLSSGLRPLKDSASVVCEGESFRDLVNLVSCC